MALAVFGVFVLPWLSSRNSHDITTASEGGDAAAPSAELPDVVELHCLPENIVVRNASVRPQDDGLHIRVINKLAQRTEVWVTSETDWSSGHFSVPVGASNWVVSPPLGHLVVGCNAGLQQPERDVELVDEDNLYVDPSLDCKAHEVGSDPTEIEVTTRSSSLATAVRSTLTNVKMNASDDIAPMNGYPEKDYTTPMAEPAVRILRDGETIAIVYLTGEIPDELVGVDEPARQSSWGPIRLIESCPKFREPLKNTAPS